MGAISVAIAMSLAAVCVYKPLPRTTPIKASPRLFISLIAAAASCFKLAEAAGTPKFMTALTFLHVAVLVPLFGVPRPERLSAKGMDFKILIPLLLAMLGFVHATNTLSVRGSVASFWDVPSTLRKIFLSHPAQASVSFDVVWVGIISVLWYVTSGSTFAVVIKLALLGSALAVTVPRYFGASWWFVVSLIPMAGLLAAGGAALILTQARTRNETNRARILAKLGVQEAGVIPGTDKAPPTVGTPRTVVGFWHPFWQVRPGVVADGSNAGGGGERVLWTAVAWLQREDPNVISLVYSGDYPTASKEEILAKVKVSVSLHES